MSWTRFNGADTSSASRTASVPSTNIAFGCFFKITTDRNNYSTIFNLANTGGGTEYGWELITDADGTTLTLSYAATGALSPVFVITATNLTVGQIYFAGFNGIDSTGKGELFLKRLGASTLTRFAGSGTSRPFTPNAIYIGRDVDAGYSFNGPVGGASLWSAPKFNGLTAAEWDLQSRQIEPVRKDALWAHWPLHSANFQDASGRGRHLTSGGGTIGAEAGPPVPQSWQLGGLEQPRKHYLFVTAAAAPPATPVIISAATPAPLAWTPPPNSLFAGFGQAAQPAFVASAPLVAALAALPAGNWSRVVEGFGQPPPPPAAAPVVIAALDVRPPLRAPAPQLLSGFGDAAQPPAIISAPLRAPAADIPLRPAIVRGFGAPSVPPVPPPQLVLYAVDPRPPALPPQPYLLAGAGQAAQPPYVLSAPFAAPSTELPPMPSLSVGAGATSALQAPLIVQAPLVAPFVPAPPAGLVVAGFGQAAQPAFVVAATVVAPRADLPPPTAVLAGIAPVVPPPPSPAVIVMAPLQAPAAGLPPLPSVLRGAGKAAQPPTVVSAALMASRAELAPQVTLTAGVAPAPPQPFLPIISAPLAAPFASLPAALPVVVRGFGQAAASAVLVRAPLEAPRTEIPIVPVLAAGAGRPSDPATIVAAPLVAPAAPYQPALTPLTLPTGAGEPAQPPFIVTAVLVAPPTTLPPQNSFVSVLVATVPPVIPTSIGWARATFVIKPRPKAIFRLKPQ